MKHHLKRGIAVAFFVAGAVAIASETDTLAELKVEFRFGAANKVSNSWQASAFISHQMANATNAMPLYRYSFDSNGLSESQLIGAPVAKGINPFNVDGEGAAAGIQTKSLLIMVGFAAAGLLVAESLTEGESAAPPPDTTGGGLAGDLLGGLAGDLLGGLAGDLLGGDTLGGLAGDTLGGLAGDTLGGLAGDTLGGIAGDALGGLGGDALGGLGG